MMENLYRTRYLVRCRIPSGQPLKHGPAIGMQPFPTLSISSLSFAKPDVTGVAVRAYTRIQPLIEFLSLHRATLRLYSRNS